MTTGTDPEAVHSEWFTVTDLDVLLADCSAPEGSRTASQPETASSFPWMILVFACALILRALTLSSG